MLQRALRLIYPGQCLLCDELTEGEGGLCGRCWRGTPFLLGHGCDACGAPLMGPASDIAVWCDDCRAAERPWARGRSVMLYEGTARRMVLALKRGDRLDLAPVLAQWMAVRAQPLIEPEMVVVPVPLHWRRLAARRYNQAAVLAQAMARRLGCPFWPDALRRARATPKQDGKGIDDRFANLESAIQPARTLGRRMEGRPVLLVDDVMTSGATLSACTQACQSAGAGPISVMTLARAVKNA